MPSTGRTQRGELCLRLGFGVGPGLDKVERVRLDGADGLGATTQKGLGHRRLIRRRRTAIQRVVRRLECHLDKCIRREAVAGNEALAVSLKL